MGSKITHTRQEVASLLGISLRLVDKAIANETLPVRRIGRRVLISQESLKSFLAATPSAPEGEARNLERRQRRPGQGGGQ